MSRASANGIEIEYDVCGDANDPPIVLIMGLAAQLTSWREPFVNELAKRGFQVIRFDNRDIGLSTYLDEVGVPDMTEVEVTGLMPSAPYSLEDMADDVAGLLDALGIERAHIVGASMGGLIAQAFAISHPDRILSLCSWMSTTGDPAVGQTAPALRSMMVRSKAPTTVSEAEAGAITAIGLLGSPGYPADEEQVRENARTDFLRSNHPAGAIRHTLAIFNQSDRTTALAKVSVPTLVVHGEADNLADPSGGRATADAIPGAEFWLQAGVGHDIPPALYSEIAERIAANCRRVLA